MKKIWLGFATLLLGSSLTYGNNTDIPNTFSVEQAEQATALLENNSGLTPKRPQTTVIRAQQSVPPAPFIPVNDEAPRVAQAEPKVFAVAASEPTTGNNDAYFFAELERLNSMIQQLGAGTPKPNPKKSWSTPKLAGRLHHDLFTVSQPDGATPNYKNKAGLNEFRVGITGTGYEAFDYKVEFMMVGDGKVNLVDTWIGAKNVPGLGYFRVGHYNIETGLMYMGGSSNTTLTNFSPVTQSFNLGRKFGASSEHLFADKRVRWIYGIYQGQNTNVTRAVQADNQGYIFNTRMSYAPYFADGGRKVLHIGGHYSYVGEKSSHLGPPSAISTFLGGTNFLGQSPLTTGAITGINHHHRGGVELAYQSGPFRVLSETFIADFGKAGTARGTVAEVSYFLTGENRVYSLENGVFVGLAKVNRPFRPFKCGDWNLVDGMGAWQAVARYNYTDLGDWRDTNGGYQHDWTVGMNWFWTTNLRCIFEYTHSTQIAGSYQDVFGTSIRVSW